MTYLQFLNGKKNLPDLVRLSFSLLILDIYSGVTWPGCFVNAMACAVLSGRAKVMFTDFFKIGKSNPLGI
jgi:hypothetical protein